MDLRPIESEFIQFDIDFVSEFTNSTPKIKVYLDDEIMHECTMPQGEHRITFFSRLKTNQKHTIKVIRSNKLPGQDQMVRIVNLRIDKINIRDLVWHTSVYYPDYPEPWATEQREQGIELEYPVYGETWFGHNGTWLFEFDSPFWYWLMKKVVGER